MVCYSVVRVAARRGSSTSAGERAGSVTVGYTGLLLLCYHLMQPSSLRSVVLVLVACIGVGVSTYYWRSAAHQF
jgi:hypothetical protein